jgi:hypothetical protein
VFRADLIAHITVRYASTPFPMRSQFLARWSGVIPSSTSSPPFILST